MSKITTEDCKSFLIEEFNKQNIATVEKEWKRTSKYKNDAGLVVRDFSHPRIGNVSLVENNGHLELGVASANKIISVRKFDSSQIEDAKTSIIDFYKNHNMNSADKAAHNPATPHCFSFFFDDTDDSEMMENMVAKKKINGVITGFPVFFGYKFDDTYAAHHISPILGKILPSFCEETQEGTFTIYSEYMGMDEAEKNDMEEMPKIKLLDFIEKLSKLGFTYDIEKCPLGKIFKSYEFKEEGAEPISKLKM